MGCNDSGVFFCDENDVYSYNFKKDSVYPIFKYGATYCISLYNSEEMSIAFVEGYDIYTFEVSEERKSSINTKRNTDPDIYLYDVSTDGKAVVWGSGNTILFSTESVASDLYSANFSFENDTDAQSSFFSMWSIIYETKYDNAFLLATDKDDIFDLVSAAAVSSVYAKIVDNIEDSKGLKKFGYRRFKAIFSRKYEKSVKLFPDIAKTMLDMVNYQIKIEKKENVGIDEAAEPTATAMKSAAWPRKIT